MNRITVEHIRPESWAGLADLAHQVCFGEQRPDALNTHHFVVGVFKDNELSGYFTCLEMDSETVYIQYGGVFPNSARSVSVLPGYLKMLDLLGESHKRVWTRVQNTNQSMLKLALYAGFVITGVSQFKTKTFVELTKEFEGS